MQFIFIEIADIILNDLISGGVNDTCTTVCRSRHRATIGSHRAANKLYHNCAQSFDVL